MRRWQEVNKCEVKMITAVVRNSIIFWKVRSCSLVGNYRRDVLVLFPSKRQKCIFFRNVRHFYQTTRRHFPERDILEKVNRSWINRMLEYGLHLNCSWYGAVAGCGEHDNEPSRFIVTRPKFKPKWHFTVQFCNLCTYIYRIQEYIVIETFFPSIRVWHYSPLWALASLKMCFHFCNTHSMQLWGLLNIYVFRRWGCQSPTWRTRVPVFVWHITFDLFGMGEPPCSCATAAQFSRFFEHLSPIITSKLDIIGKERRKEALLSFPQVENCTVHIRNSYHRQFDRWAQLRVSSSDWVRQLHTILCVLISSQKTHNIIQGTLALWQPQHSGAEPPNRFRPGPSGRTALLKAGGSC